MSTIGFIGTGRMGAPRAGHLIAAGYSLVLHDAPRGAARPFVLAAEDHTAIVKLLGCPGREGVRQ